MADTLADRCREFNGLMGEVLSHENCSMLKKHLAKMGFFIAPASTKYHGNYEGGLFDHSYQVTTALLFLTERLELKWERKESPYLVGMLHDLCKCDQYVKTVDGYEYRKNLTLTGHGEKSVILAQNIINLTEEEMLCIRWHMGAYDSKEVWNNLGAAIERYPTVLYTHTADMMASRIAGI